MLRPLFFNPPDTEAQLDALNTGAPAADRDIHGERVGRIAATAARLAGLADPDGHAARGGSRSSQTPPRRALPPRRSRSCPLPSRPSLHPSSTTFGLRKEQADETHNYERLTRPGSRSTARCLGWSADREDRDREEVARSAARGGSGSGGAV